MNSLRSILKSTGRTSVYLLCFALILVITFACFRLPVISSIDLLVQGAFGNKFGIGSTAAKATPLMLTGLGIIVSWKAGMFNIGGEGQFVVGGLFGAMAFELTQALHVQVVIAILLILFAACIGGGFWGGIAGLLKITRSVDVVISTILLNFVAFQIMKWLVSGPMMEKSGGLPVTDSLPSSDILWHFDPQTDLHVGFIIAILVCIGLWFLMFRTKAGFEMRIVGENAFAARANRIPAKKRQLQAMVISGALCGLAGGIEYSAMANQIGLDFNQNWGFLAIPVALAAGLHPLFIIPSAILFGSLFAGSNNLERFTKSGDSIIYVVQALIVLALVAIQARQMHNQKLAGEAE